MWISKACIFEIWNILIRCKTVWRCWVYVFVLQNDELSNLDCKKYNDTCEPIADVTWLEDNESQVPCFCFRVIIFSEVPCGPPNKVLFPVSTTMLLLMVQKSKIHQLVVYPRYFLKVLYIQTVVVLGFLNYQQYVSPWWVGWGSQSHLLTQGQAMRSTETPKHRALSCWPFTEVMGRVGVTTFIGALAWKKVGENLSTWKRTENEKRVPRWFKNVGGDLTIVLRVTLKNIPKTSWLESPGDAWFGETPLLSEIQRFQKKKLWNPGTDLKKWYDCMMQIWYRIIAINDKIRW